MIRAENQAKPGSRRGKSTTSKARKPKRIRVEVTAGDIRLGERVDPAMCAVARALKRAVPGATEASCSSFYLTAYSRALEGETIGETILDVRTPKKVSNWIVRFDAGEPVKPLAFALVPR